MASGDASPAQGRQGAFADMLSEFARHWDRIDIVTPRAPGAKPVRLFGNTFFWPSRYARPLQWLQVIATGKRLAQERQYALIASHDYGLFLNGLGSAALSRWVGAPYVSEIHHIEGHPRAATPAEGVRRRAALAYIGWARQRARAFRVVNGIELPSLLRSRGVAEERILVLHSLYLNFEVFHPRRRLPEYDVAFVGRLAPNKGLFLLLDGLAQVKRKVGRLRAAIVGEGPLKAPLLRRIRQLGLAEEVRFLGWLPAQPDLADLYNRTRVLVCSSFSEGGPRVVAEALACGTPVISTPVGMAGELIRDGENGYLFQWDARTLADRIVCLLEDEALREGLGRQAPASVQRFEKRAVIAEYAQAYQRLVRL